ncbi:hypothetical protein Y032_0002g1106 [Ancylostoma ceylanicum]|uniref:Uncharacterized protein n=1 Tax=Ancylostoma ceylanicum TaxID=53326 RepID=A0A016VZH3_9BILA|nr:hypothetical protein Y032_0002g1106 [Ancylostoma ceylanicum]
MRRASIVLAERWRCATDAGSLCVFTKQYVVRKRGISPREKYVARNLIRTKDKLCTAIDSTVEMTIARILEENGYSGDPATITTWLPYSTPDGIPLNLPYVGNRPARAVNKVVKQSGLPTRLVLHPPPTLKHLLTSTRIYEEKCPQADCQYCNEEKICQLRGTVCLIKCDGCGEKYVGETMRPLRKRMDEHRRASTNPACYPLESFSRHRTLENPTPTF